MKDRRAVIIERELPYPPDRVWRALTQPELLSEWLMNSDFVPELGAAFSFDAGWGSIACEVREVTPMASLSYTWTAADVDTIVTWTLEPIPKGTRLRLEQVGFTQDQKQAYAGATGGWRRFIDNLAALLSRQLD
ncbi:SRPBCC domain-containing protein [Cognatiyoonia sp. IB215182]|uniref:SRPBCC family protein n=1 Tax=Cognatiyoonia sp. IB215182 TaxID=3097353 RepID=UPI002A121888|nr:SRPBCC domain-containing protein [Cognatiyoonia sp. IB215182]MDX8353625.1 SRPBCC domain-containing protein [Cognatiyoonia sp. IB215182]